ncbi:MAG: hypothetical protein QW594_03995 [Candidatus Woesearchaeota archaeon]
MALFKFFFTGLIALLVVVPFLYSQDYACYNPAVQSIPLCTPLQLSYDQIIEQCCANDPTCIAAYVKPYDDQACQKGCCILQDTCVAYTFKQACTTYYNGVFNDSLGGACFFGKTLVAEQCKEECCCTNLGFMMLLPSLCQKEQGITIKNTRSLEHCQQLCSTYPQISGCGKEKPVFYIQGKATIDCTGGDGIVGNRNDCGCPAGQTCLPSGKCVLSSLLQTPAQQSSYWCAHEGNVFSVSSCDQCFQKPLVKNKTCVSAFDYCSANSRYYQGICLCNEGFYDDVCSATPFLDLYLDGCVASDPCKKPSGFSWWLLIPAVFLLFLLIYVFKRKKKVPPPPFSPTVFSNSLSHPPYQHQVQPPQQPPASPYQPPYDPYQQR